MKKYVKPAIYHEDMSLATVITLSCAENITDQQPTWSDVFDRNVYIDEYGNAVFTTNPCAIQSNVEPSVADFTAEMADCHYKYNCYHGPNDADFNTLFGS